MEIGHKFIGDILVINIYGELYSEQVMQMEYKLLEFSTKTNRVIIDCEELEYVDSKGLGVLISFQKLLEERGGEMAVCSPNGKVEKVFELTHFDKFTKVYATLEDALKGFED
ncbi:MAG: STAS domain-containing protein [Candidatus Stygibacter australis]|nr:STAS domain-containing protein [Candidatus Stygibacter australis]MDP8323071.1 STAS domain-containing protein [Candidatus Stygibacter australis]